MVDPRMPRLIIDDAPADGDWNMAIDEALLESTAASGEPVLRWYAWREPTISLGYFQAVPKLAPDDPLHGLAIVRRLSGGGAILHHHEWTYSCVLPEGHPLARRPTDLYVEVHQAIIEVLQRLGAHASLRGQRSAGDERNVFLCFRRGDPRDVILAGHKIVGSAQRRRGGAVLQHGSVLLRSSVHVPNQPGLRDLAEVAIDDPALRDRLAEAVVRRLAGETIKISDVRTSLTPNEQQTAQSLVTERYSRPDWKAK